LERLWGVGRFLDFIDQAVVLEQLGGEHFSHALEISEQIEFSQLGEKCLQLRKK
jgi:hypothetical protein